MIDNNTLEAIQKFLQRNVSTKIKLQAAASNDINDYTLVPPAVHIGWIPPPIPEALPPEVRPADIPCLIVGMDEGSDDSTEASLNIRISAVVYSPGFYDGIKFAPNFKGYQDLLNLMTLTRRELMSKIFIEGMTSVNPPVKWGMYKDQPHPYWYGWLTFSVTIQPIGYLPDTNNF